MLLWFADSVALPSLLKGSDAANCADPPAWRLALGNIAAGATAGAVVEAGELLIISLS